MGEVLGGFSCLVGRWTVRYVCTRRSGDLGGGRGVCGDVAAALSLRVTCSCEGSACAGGGGGCMLLCVGGVCYAWVTVWCVWGGGGGGGTRRVCCSSRFCAWPAVLLAGVVQSQTPSPCLSALAWRGLVVLYALQHQPQPPAACTSPPRCMVILGCPSLRRERERVCLLRTVVLVYEDAGSVFEASLTRVTPAIACAA